MTLLIKNVHLLGEEKQRKQSADVFVNGDKISAIGNLGNKKAEVIVDGQGAHLSPGFIDVNTDSDHFLSVFDYPNQEDFLGQGVTTIIGGMCGSSLAPLLYGSLESIQKWADINKVNVNWHRVEELFSLLEKRLLAVNFATLAGHSTIRRALIGESLRDLTKNELMVFGETLARALREGAMGFSSGLSYVHSRETPYSELKFLTNITRQYGGVYATHLRKVGEGVGESVEETIKLAKESGARTLISHFVPFQGSEEGYEASLKKIDELPGEIDLHFDLYIHDTSVLALYTFLPIWAQNGGQAVMVRNVNDEWLRPRIIKDLPRILPRDFIVAYAKNNDVLVGRSLEELGEIFGLRDSREALLKLMRVTGLRASIFYKNINARLIKNALKSKRFLIASNAASFKQNQGEKRLKPERATSTFTAFLSLVESEKLMPLEQAIRKITLEPAQKFGLEGRGAIREGAFADLVGFRGSDIKFVVVNGGLVLKDGSFQGWFPGRVLKHHG